jgi:hypothetical protein
MCTNIIEQATITGAAKGADGWFRMKTALVSYDHPIHLTDEHALNIDFLESPSGARVAVEMDATSARALAAAITEAIRRAEEADAIV